ncbi:hypothetical protein A5714_02315 [Mycobacterium sp. E2462]|uniref:hypothetical protein n=1 Tax=Mycobacterium sp. E2462 TaxID=1834133 RepID=UPI000801FA34|nr:hypothetical protein [Mycobacterium sp. E2462]OBI06576.1 hypothetical protein A5714_02315 [Mycobacterium sp. E2462]
MSDDRDSQASVDNGESSETPERELASVTLRMGSGGPANPLILQPGAIAFEPDPRSETTPLTNWVCDLSESDFNRYLDALDALSKIHVTNLFSTVRQSALDFMAVVGDAYKALYENQISTIRPDDFIHWTIRLRTGVFGVCSAIHHHQEQSYAAVKRKFGEDSPEHEAMKVAFGEIYDNCFGYRFLYKLRHCMVHYSMRAVDIGTDSRMHEGQDLRWFEINMKRSVMLKSKKLLNAKLRAELEALDEDPVIVEMQTAAFKELIKTNRRIVEIQYPEIADICATVREFDALFEGIDGSRGLAISRSQEIRSPFTFEFYPIAGQVIMAARQYIDGT